jgi:Cd(II)/Pb(II)-responsive transcriptional regulator
MPKTCKIGDLAREFNVPVETVRYYEREGLLPLPTRTAGNYRLYSEAHRHRLSFIRRCRSLDMTLDEIRRLLRFADKPSESCKEVNELLDEHIVHVKQRVRELRRLKSELEALRERCGDVRSIKECEILRGLAAAAVVKRAREGHVKGAHRRYPDAHYRHSH